MSLLRVRPLLAGVADANWLVNWSTNVSDSLALMVLSPSVMTAATAGISPLRRASSALSFDPPTRLGRLELIDHFLDRCQEAEIDAIFDGENFHVMGVMEHIEPAGIHSGDSNAVLPAFNLMFCLRQADTGNVLWINVPSGHLGAAIAEWEAIRVPSWTPILSCAA